jgi:hypothetical protein
LDAYIEARPAARRQLRLLVTEVVQRLSVASSDSLFVVYSSTDEQIELLNIPIATAQLLVGSGQTVQPLPSRSPSNRR